MNTNVPIPILVIDPLELSQVIAGKIKDAEIELKKHPTYDNARNLQRLKRDYAANVNELRSRVKIVYSFEEDLLNYIEYNMEVKE